MPKLPKRRYRTPETNSVHETWMNMVRQHNAVLLRDGENPEDYPEKAVAYETLNFGWILSAPHGQRKVLVQY